MNRLEGLINSIDYIIDSKRKRHIMGGILVSTSLLLAGLAVTIITLRHEENKNDNEIFIE